VASLAIGLPVVVGVAIQSELLLAAVAVETATLKAVLVPANKYKLNTYMIQLRFRSPYLANGTDFFHLEDTLVTGRTVRRGGSMKSRHFSSKNIYELS
jgi:hypothetical protein